MPFQRLLTSTGLVCALLACGPTLGSSQTPAPRSGHVMTAAGAAGGVLLVGGQIVDNTPRLVDSLWLWTGSAWRVLSDAGPRNRTLPGAAFDTRRNVLVVYGGLGLGSGSRFGDTWEWDGRRWQERNVQTPGPRDHHAMAYDEARGKTVMYGGQTADRRSFPTDTWTWDGSVWTRADSTTGPGGLGHHAMAYDRRRQRVVLFGGSGSGPATGDTWEWDGARWQRVSTEGPGPRTHHRMAYDAARGVTVMHGGTETWTWDGARWERRATDGPSARNVSAMAYDDRRQRVVLFGGGGSVNTGGVPPYGFLNDTWEWDGTRWTRAAP